MSLSGFKASNHPQQTGKRGADPAVDDRGTNQVVWDALNERFGGFSLDVAAALHNAKCSDFYTAEDDGLSRDWIGNVWCNPPYSDVRSWVQKAWDEWHCGDDRDEDIWRVQKASGDLHHHVPGSKEAAQGMSRHIHRSSPVRVVTHGHGRVCVQPHGKGPWVIQTPGRRGESRLIVGMECEMHSDRTPPDLIVMLLPANRTEQGWWQDHVEPYRDRPGSPLRVEFLRGRMRFDRPQAVIGPKGDRPPFGCCLLIWSR